MISRCLLQVLIVNCLLGSARYECCAAEATMISALLDDGRVVSGAPIGADDQRLWLRQQADGLELASGFVWSGIRSVNVNGNAVDIDVLRTSLPERRARQPLPLLAPGTAAQTNPEALPRIVPRPVRSVEIQCTLANWDADAEIDGLLVTVWPLNEDLQLEPVAGMLDLVLRAEHAGLMFPPRHFSHLPELARISHRLRLDDFASGPAVYRLPFGYNDPETDPTISRYGVVQARLGINGLGVFEAADSSVRLRNPSSLRDQLQHATGQRRFSFERP